MYDVSRKIIARKENMLQAYTQNKKLSQDILDKISAATDAYTQAQKSQAKTALAKNQPQESVVASQSVSLADLLNAAPPTTGGVQIGLTSAAPTKIMATTSSISQLQNAAAGTATIETSFEFAGDAGLSF